MDWQKEIVELHEFFEAWLGGRLPKTDEAYKRLTDVMAESFSIVNPDGQVTARDNLLNNLYDAHNSRQNWKMWIENMQLCYQENNLLLATYEEWHKHNDTTTARISTVVFREDAKAVNHCIWLHVHETWLGEAKTN